MLERKKKKKIDLSKESLKDDQFNRHVEQEGISQQASHCYQQ